MARTKNKPRRYRTLSEKMELRPSVTDLTKGKRYGPLTNPGPWARSPAVGAWHEDDPANIRARYDFYLPNRPEDVRAVDANLNQRAQGLQQQRNRHFAQRAREQAIQNEIFDLVDVASQAPRGAVQLNFNDAGQLGQVQPAPQQGQQVHQVDVAMQAPAAPGLAAEYQHTWNEYYSLAPFLPNVSERRRR